MKKIIALLFIIVSLNVYAEEAKVYQSPMSI